jgi:plastocyanin
MVMACTRASADNSGDDSEFSGVIHQVVIEDEAFNPAEIIIVEGETVTWINQSTERCTVTSWDTSFDEDFTAHVMIGRTWDSGDIQPGQSFSRTFERAGSYDYFSFPLLESPGYPLVPYLVPAIDGGKVIVKYSSVK